jgi:7-cyano-7-deazaguanine reductase
MKAIENIYRKREYEVSMRFPEFTCLCPMTAQPDFAEILITYVPDAFLVELKSLKIYLNSYRDRGIFHEEAVNAILDDFVKTIRPRRVSVVGTFNVRGGIHTTVKAQYTGSPAQ